MRGLRETDVLAEFGCRGFGRDWTFCRDEGRFVDWTLFGSGNGLSSFIIVLSFSDCYCAIVLFFFESIRIQTSMLCNFITLYSSLLLFK